MVAMIIGRAPRFPQRPHRARTVRQECPHWPRVGGGGGGGLRWLGPVVVPLLVDKRGMQAPGRGGGQAVKAQQECRSVGPGVGEGGGFGRVLPVYGRRGHVSSGGESALGSQAPPPIAPLPRLRPHTRHEIVPETVKPHHKTRQQHGGPCPSVRVATTAVPPLCDMPSGCCSFTGPWTVTRSSLRMLRRVAAFCRPLRPVLLLVLLPRLGSQVVHRAQ